MSKFDDGFKPARNHWGRSQAVRILSWVLFSALWTATAWSQSAGRSELKIGFINSLDVLYGTEEGKREITEVQAYLEEKQREYDSRRMELERLKEQFGTQQHTLNVQTRAEMQRTIEEDDRKLRRFQEDTQLEISRRRDEILARESEKIQIIINEYAKEKGFAAIFLRNESQIYVDPALDFTQEIIRIYNERYPVTALESSAAASSSTAQP